jgi:hypothetical protein
LVLGRREKGKLREWGKFQRHSNGQRFKRVRLPRVSHRVFAIPEPFVQAQGTADRRARDENECEKRAKAREIAEDKLILQEVR